MALQTVAASLRTDTSPSHSHREESRRGAGTSPRVAMGGGIEARGTDGSPTAPRMPPVGTMSKMDRLAALRASLDAL